jgi:hypothetical protein
LVGAIFKKKEKYIFIIQRKEKGLRGGATKVLNRYSTDGRVNVKTIQLFLG